MSTDTAPQDPLAALKKYDTKFLGHPSGVGWLSFAEFWERFSYYGMLMILVLYLQQYLLQPGHIEQIWGFQAFSKFVWSLPWVFGPHNTTALASNTAQLYGGLVFVTPLIGGLLTDRFFRRTGAVATGAVLMVIGTFLTAFSQTFLIALAFLLVGVGFFKSNIAAQVGDLYRIDDPRRATGFQIYFMGIQLAVIIAPVVSSTLSMKVEWHLGFVAAGVGMVLGLLIYLGGRRRYPPEPVRKERAKVKRPPLTRRDWGVVVLLVALLPVLALSIVGNQEMFNVYFLWAERNYQLTILGWAMPAPFLGSLDAFVSAGTMILVIGFWTWYGKHRREPDEITKIVIGVVISMFAPLVLALISARVAATGHPVSLYWALGFHLINDIGFANVLPIGIALYSRAAPKGLGSTMIAIYYLHLFLANTVIIGPLGGYLGSIPDTTFWYWHVGLMAIAAVILLAAKLLFGHILAPREVEAAPA
jgi:POT family proton-dependent oligopeptide transporter